MDMKLFEDLEQLQKDYNHSHEERIEYIKSKLGLYISNYHFKKGDDMSKHPEIMEKINHDKNEILDYINELYEQNQKAFELVKALNSNKEN